MGSPKSPSHLTSGDLDRSKSRLLRFWVVADLCWIHIFASSLITTTLIWISPKGVCWQAGFFAVPLVFLVEVIFTLHTVVFEIQADFQNCHIWAWINLAIGQSYRSCTYTLFLLHMVEIELIFALCAAVSEIQAEFQNCQIWASNLVVGQSSISCTYTFFLPLGSQWRLFSLYGQRFLRYRRSFKIAIFGHETWSLAKVPEVAHMLSFSPKGV